MVWGKFLSRLQYFAPFSGMQCTAVALISLILLMNQGVPELEDIYQRDPSFLDLILHEGTSLYDSIVHERGYTFSWLFLIGSVLYLQVMITYMRACMSLKFG